MINARDTRLVEQLIEHEGLRLKPYKDTEGKLTIGIGRNLDDVGISEGEARFMLGNDIARAFGAAGKYRWFSRLSDNRQRVILDMLFNLGATRFATFKRMIAALERGNFEDAAAEMIDSKWAHQVKSRAWKLVDMMRSG